MIFEIKLSIVVLYLLNRIFVREFDTCLQVIESKSNTDQFYPFLKIFFRFENVFIGEFVGLVVDCLNQFLENN